MKRDPTRKLIVVCLGLGGFAGLGWETIWQIKASLAIGVSSQATALVIAATMGGMAIGTGLMGFFLQRRASRQNPFVLYGIIELVIGLCGFFVHQEFALVARLDEVAFHLSAVNASLVHLVMIALTLGPPSMAMGASIPVLGLIARTTGASLGILYGINTLGAAIGTLMMAFVVLPFTGIATACVLLALLNAAIALTMFALSRGQATAHAKEEKEQPGRSYHGGFYLVAFTSGFAIFTLEVVYFRAMRAAFLSTTYSFAIMLGSVLLALAVGAHSARLLRNDRRTLGIVLALGGTMVFIVTPIVERLDAFVAFYVINPHLCKFLLALGVLGPLVAILGVLFPLLLDGSKSPLEWGLLHASNTFGAILGALCAAWIFLPLLGLARTSWLVAFLLVVAGLLTVQEGAIRLRVGLAGLGAFLLAFVGESGIGQSRIVGLQGKLSTSGGFEIVAYRETPDFTVAVVGRGESRGLYIDGFDASSDEERVSSQSYMAWMGRLPMLAHPAPKDALVICFGRGETANALRLEDPRSLDIVDISKAVFELAPYFEGNDNVLSDPRVTPIVMDGRTWMRRTDRMYDVVTLEPMPPTFAGMNGLYSREFYELVSERLHPGGTIAQWVPFHLVTADQASAISRTFIEVFPDAVMWIHMAYQTGILVGRKGTKSGMGWPGLERDAPGRELTREEILTAVQLDPAGLEVYGKTGVVITDDNQYLAYGMESQEHDFGSVRGLRYQRESLERIAAAGRGR
ncbi:MAG: fused MFS/spermidine synthase [Deltaproteobacteria bacterium]|nr:fused MFS/spermidine synthase [Deltaproteobacteria bacterium]MBW2254030.1 fused MFS/spermidine synthase [Deltaproteobacteria bacterium]